MDVSLVVGTAVVDAASAPFLAPLPAASPAPMLAVTISVKARAPVDWLGVMTFDSMDNRSVGLGVLASPPRPPPPPPFATAAATAAAVATAFLRTSSCTERLSAAATIPGELELLYSCRAPSPPLSLPLGKGEVVERRPLLMGWEAVLWP